VSLLRAPPIIDVVAGVRADRITAVDASELLDRLGDPALLDAGLVNVIGLDAIRRKLADRWPIKRAQVWNHVQCELERILGQADSFLRTDDVSFTIAQPGSDRYAAQAVCLSILEEALKFFLGALRPADVDVRSVSSIGGGQMISQPIDLARLRRAPAPLSAVATPAEPQAAAVTAVSTDLKLRVDGVWNLKRNQITSFLIERDGVRGKSDMADLEEIDVATLVYASTVLDEQVEQGGSLSLHLPLSFASLATQRTRQRLLAITHSVRETMRRTVLLEIADLDPGVPPSRLIETVGLVRSLCVGVIGRVKPTKAALAAVKGCGLRGVAVNADYLAPHQPEFDARLKAFAAMAKDISPNLVIHGLPDAKLVAVAMAAGFTHASVIEG
jgi:hypothetical protein